MPHRALLLVLIVILLVGYGSSQQSDWFAEFNRQLAELRQQSRFKTLSECETKVREWEQWADGNVPKCKAALKDADRLEAENEKLRDENRNLRSSNEGLEHMRIEVNLATAAIGIGIGIFCAFLVVRALKRVWPVSSKGKQLVFMVCGAVWITGSALVAVNDSDLSKHPVNMLFTVLVYSLPGLLFGGIGFWWFGKGEQQEARP